jgi:hypothetical protein
MINRPLCAFDEDRRPSVDRSRAGCRRVGKLRAYPAAAHFADLSEDDVFIRSAPFALDEAGGTVITDGVAVGLPFRLRAVEDSIYHDRAGIASFIALG